MNVEDEKELLDLLVDAEIELDAWKDMRPDAAGPTIELLNRIRIALQRHRPDPFITESQSIKK